MICYRWYPWLYWTTNTHEFVPLKRHEFVMVSVPWSSQKTQKRNTMELKEASIGTRHRTIDRVSKEGSEAGGEGRKGSSCGLGVCGNHRKWLQLRTCKIWCKNRYIVAQKCFRFLFDSFWFLRLIPKRRFAQNHFDHTEKEVRPKRRFGTPKNEKGVFQTQNDFLEMAHTNFAPSIRKTTYQPLI